jgi:hypothetical protein
VAGGVGHECLEAESGRRMCGWASVPFPCTSTQDNEKHMQSAMQLFQHFFLHVQGTHCSTRARMSAGAALLLALRHTSTAHGSSGNGVSCEDTRRSCISAYSHTSNAYSTSRTMQVVLLLLVPAHACIRCMSIASATSSSTVPGHDSGARFSRIRWQLQL